MRKLLRLGVVAGIAVILLTSIGSPQASAIVGGNNAKEQYGAASIWYPDNQGVNRHRCTVSVISRYWGLTAGHCAPVVIPGKTQIRAKSLDNTVGYTNVGVETVIVHPQFTPGNPNTEPNKNDIALIRFEKPVTNSQILKLPSSSPVVGTLGKVASWGYICDDVSVPINCGLPHTQLLQELGLKVVSDSTCTFLNDPQNQMCFVAPSHIDSMACNGDSGAPFVKKGFNDWVVMGTIAGDGDGYFPTPTTPNVPNSCTRDENGSNGKGRAVDISRYVGWIHDTMMAYPVI